MTMQPYVPPSLSVPPAQQQAIARAQAFTPADVGNITEGEVRAMMDAARERAKTAQAKERDALLIATLFDASLRVAEVVGLDAATAEKLAEYELQRAKRRNPKAKARSRTVCPGIRPCDLARTATGWSVRILGKGNKPRDVAMSASLVAQLQAYAYQHQVAPDARLFPITRQRAWQIVKAAMDRAGVVKPFFVGSVHVLRHSGAIDLLDHTGNPQAVQDQLGHATPAMTLRYMRTLRKRRSLEINQQVDRKW